MNTSTIDTALAARLDALLQRAVRRNRYVRHGLLAVAGTDGSWGWQGAHSAADADGTPVTTAMRYPIASVTKLFTAVVVLRLVEQGRLGLGDRLVDLLPEEVTRGLHVLDGADRTAEITLEHLLGHTSGLPDYYGESPRRSRSTRRSAGRATPTRTTNSSAAWSRRSSRSPCTRCSTACCSRRSASTTPRRTRTRPAPAPRRSRRSACGPRTRCCSRKARCATRCRTAG